MLNKDIEITLLSKEDIEGKSKVLQKIGADCGKDYWTSTLMDFDDWNNFFELSVTVTGGLSGWYAVDHVLGVRPVLISDNLKELIKECKVTLENGIQIIEYGFFPHLLENIRIDDMSVLPKTGKKYVLPQNEYEYRFHFCYLTEYDYKGQKVVKKENLYYPVKHVKWYLDEENNMLISQDVLFDAPINIDNHYHGSFDAPINIDNQNYYGIFETSQLYNYLNNDFLKQLLANEVLNRENTDKIDDLSSLEAKVGKLRSQNESKREKANKLEALLKEQEQLQRESAELDAKIAELTQSLNQKVKK